MVRTTTDIPEGDTFGRIMDHHFSELKNDKSVRHLVADTLNLVTNEANTDIKDRYTLNEDIDDAYTNGEFAELNNTKRTFQGVRNILNKFVDSSIWENLEGESYEEKTMELHKFLDAQTRHSTNNKRQKFIEKSPNHQEGDESDEESEDGNGKPDDDGKDAGNKPDPTQSLPDLSQLEDIDKDAQETLDVLNKGAGMYGEDLKIGGNAERVMETVEKMKEAHKLIDMFHATIKLINSEDFKTPYIKPVKSPVPTDHVGICQGDNVLKFITSHKYMDDDQQLYNIIKKKSLENNFVMEESDIGKLTIAVDISGSMDRILQEVLGLAYAFAKIHDDAGIESRIILFNTRIAGEFNVKDWEKYLDITDSGGTDMAHVLEQVMDESEGKEEFLFITDAEDYEDKQKYRNIREMMVRKENKLHGIVINSSSELECFKDLCEKYYRANSVKHLQEIMLKDLDNK